LVAAKKALSRRADVLSRGPSCHSKFLLHQLQSENLGGHFNPGCDSVLSRFLLIEQACFGPPAPRPPFEDMAVAEKAIEHGGNGRTVAEEFAQSSTGRLEVNSVLVRS
jgi:hypothetical protein